MHNNNKMKYSNKINTGDKRCSAEQSSNGNPQFILELYDIRSVSFNHFGTTISKMYQVGKARFDCARSSAL